MRWKVIFWSSKEDRQKKKKTGDLLARKNREVGSELIVNICVRRDQLVAYSFSPENIAFGG